jgi:hypothetical protein
LSALNPCSELELMSKLRHNNVVMLYGGSTIPPRLAIVTEYVPLPAPCPPLLNVTCDV